MEKKIEKYLIRGIEDLGGICVKFPSLFYGGFPDRMVLLPGGGVLFVELKSPGQKPRPVQASAHRRLRRLGFRVEVLDSLDAVNQFIKTLQYA